MREEDLEGTIPRHEDDSNTLMGLEAEHIHQGHEQAAQAIEQEARITKMATIDVLMIIEVKKNQKKSGKKENKREWSRSLGIISSKRKRQKNK